MLSMWRPSGLQREETSPIEPSSILQRQSGCSRDHTCEREKHAYTWTCTPSPLRTALFTASVPSALLSLGQNEGLALASLRKVRFFFFLFFWKVIMDKDIHLKDNAGNVNLNKGVIAPNHFAHLLPIRQGWIHRFRMHHSFMTFPH